MKKSSESAFKLLFYSLVFGYCSYILFNGNYNFYHDTSNCWKGELIQYQTKKVELNVSD